MKTITFITGNQHKADFLARNLGQPVTHHKLDLDELQSLDRHAVAEHKVRQAYGILKSPVLIDDSALMFDAMGRLPGTFIKSFLDEIGLDGLCRLAASLDNPAATAIVSYALFDGKTLHLFEGTVHGRIAKKPKGHGGHGFDPIFINDGQDKTRAEMTQAERDLASARFKALQKLKIYLDKQ